MIRSEPAPAAARHLRWPDPTSSAARPATKVTVYACGQDEADLVRALAPALGVVPTITEAPPTEASVGPAAGSRCISIGHKTQVTNATLRALGEAGVRYVSTRSVGHDHIDVSFARSVGISVEPVAYSPGSVADYTLMLILTALRHARSVITRADAHDFRSDDVRGRELRDLTVGVIGTGRIGVAVMDRLRGFGCRILAHDPRPKAHADYVPLDRLLRRSDVVTLHAPLTVDTHHLLDRRRIAQMKHGAVVVNTARGALVDTEALVCALETGRLGGAGLDVVEGEEGVFYADRRDRPIESEPLLRLQRMRNVLISPHIAYYTDHALRDMVQNSLINCVTFEGGGRRG